MRARFRDGWISSHFKPHLTPKNGFVSTYIHFDSSEFLIAKDGWENPLYFERIWTVYEQFVASTLDVQVYLGDAKRQFLTVFSGIYWPKARPPR